MRLIDADALKVKQQEDADLFKGDDTLSGKSRRDEALNAVANIVNAPTIDPVRHGHWEHGKELSRDYIGYACIGVDYDKWWCSECNYHVKKRPLWRYCPNCGAKMDGVTNEIN